MIKIEHSVVIEAGLQEVFAYASDWRYWADWFDGTSDFAPTADVERGIGARYRYKAWVMGLPATVETEIQDFVENSGWTGVATRGIPHRTSWHFEAVGDFTRFTYGLEGGIPIPVIGPILDALIMKGKWRQILETSLENLRSKYSSPTDSQGGADHV